MGVMKEMQFPVSVRWRGGRLTRAESGDNEPLELATPPDFRGGLTGYWSPEDLLVSKLMAMTEHSINYRSCLEVARSLREQIDFDDVRRRTESSPYGRAFFVIAEGLGIAQAPAHDG